MEGWLFAARTFIGINSEGWVAIATFAGTGAFLLGVWYGARQYVREQEARDVRRYYIDEGLWALSGSLDALIRILIQNVTASGLLVALMESAPAGTPDAPRVEDLPKLAVLDWERVALRGTRPAKVILDFGYFDELLTEAFGNMLISHQRFLNEVEQGVRTYYAAGEDNEVLAKTLASRIVSLGGEGVKYVSLPHVLEAAGVRLQKMRVSSFSQAEKIAMQDMEIGALRAELEALWDEVRPSEAKDDDRPESAEDDE